MELWARRYVVSPTPAKGRKYVEVNKDTSEESELRVFSEGEKELVKGVLGVQANVTYVETEPGGEDKTASVPQALSICIQRGAEDLAIRLLCQLTGPFPLHLVHRAGELGLFRLLYTLYDTNTPISSARLVIRMRLLSRRYQRSDPSGWRVPIPPDSTSITAGELLHWACISRNKAHIRCYPSRSVLQLDLEPHIAVSSLLSADCTELLQELVRKERVQASPEALLSALEWERLDVASALQAVHFN